MQPKDLLHSVNNQLEIIVSAAHLLTGPPDRQVTQDYRNQIIAAAFKVSNVLTNYCGSNLADDSGRLQRSPKTAGPIIYDKSE